MATKSFNEGLEINDVASAQALLKAFDDKDCHKPINKKDISQEVERGQSYLKRRYFQ